MSQPGTHFTNQPANQLTNQPTSKLTNQPTTHSPRNQTNPQSNQLLTQLATQPTNQPINQPTDRLTNDSLKQESNQASHQPINQHDDIYSMSPCVFPWSQSRFNTNRGGLTFCANPTVNERPVNWNAVYVGCLVRLWVRWVVGELGENASALKLHISLQNSAPK